MENNENNTVGETETGLKSGVETRTSNEQAAPATHDEIMSAVTNDPASSGNNRLLIATAIIVVGALIAGGYYFFTRGTSEDGGPVAVVNNIKIARAQFNDSVAMITQTASLQGANITDPEIQSSINTQAVNLLIDNTLLVQGAKDAGFKATDEQIQSEYEKLIEELGDENTLRARMTEVGLTEEKLRENISERIIVDGFLGANTEINALTVSDEETTSFYDSLTEQGGEIPPLEEVKVQIEEQILGQKRQAVVNEFLSKLREDAEIEVLI